MRARLVLLAVVAGVALVSLVVVNAVPAWAQQSNLRNDSATGRLGGEASLPLFTAAQDERKATARYLARPTAAAKAALDKQRAQTDKGEESFRHLSGTELETDQRHKWEFVERVYDQLDSLASVRKAVDAGTGDAREATDYYTTLVTRMIRFYQALSAMDDPDLALETRPLVGLFYASDALSRQDMLLARARAAGSMSAADRVAFAEAYGSQKQMYEPWIAPYLPGKEKARYDALTSSAAWKTVGAVQRSVIDPPADEAGRRLVGEPDVLHQWDAAYAKVARQVAELNLARTQGLLAHGFQRADEIRTQVLVQAGSSGAAVLAITGLIIWLILSIAAGLDRLRTQTEQGAERLLGVVARLRQGDEVDEEREFPDPQMRDEFGHVQVALVDAQRTTVRLAREQASDRRGLNAFGAVTTDRTLGQLERGLATLTTTMQRPEAAPVLEELIAADGAVTAARRHQENLSTLTSSSAESPYDRPKALLDLVNDAAVETGSPQRTSNEVRDDFHLAPQHAGGVVRVVAALVDNGLRFSNAAVSVRSHRAVYGVALEIEDRGCGMHQEDLEAANATLAQEQATFEVMATSRGRLGLFVVARLAARHHLRVQLRCSVYGGVTAVVMIDNAAAAPAPVSQPLPAQVDRQPGTGPDPTAISPGPASSAGGSPRRAATELPVRERPEQHSGSAEDSGAAEGLPQRSDPHAPALPRRTADASIHPALRAAQSTQPAAVGPQAPPDEVRDAWASYEAATHKANQQLDQQKDDRS